MREHVRPPRRRGRRSALPPHGTVPGRIGAEAVKRRAAAKGSGEALVLLAEMEELLGERVLRHAVRATE
ncbi:MULTISPECIES: hypothetical protein [unclassified Streptomyces]|uniref:hypothetical protein n=1 Tax=unclassified Streptomyces TaxID=2593676 RepID=UPI003332C696